MSGDGERVVTTDRVLKTLEGAPVNGSTIMVVAMLGVRVLSQVADSLGEVATEIHDVAEAIREARR